MDFEEQEEEMGNIPPPPGYESIPNNSSTRSKLGAGVEGASTAARKPIRYRECLKNHAVGIGGHAVDGCGEFLPAGEEGTLDALKCAACNCHRNFHRKEADGCGAEGMHPFSPYYRSSQPPAGYLHLTPPGHHRPLALPAASGGHSREDEDMSNPTSSGGGGGGGSGSKNKRFRTRFTADQKEKMLVFAERLGWRIQKHEEAAVEQFCAETGVRRQVLKVWMHNNKHTLDWTSQQSNNDSGK